MTTGPQATQADETQERFNPVLEALNALGELTRIEGTVHLETGVRVQALAALAMGWSLLASVTGGATIDLTPKDEPEEQQGGALENAAKAAFGG